jgi:hypothetical protein
MCAAVPRAANAADSLVVKPARPTTADSIRLTIVIPIWDCCTHYTYDSTSALLVGDTEILLSYQHYLPKICPMIACIDIPLQLAFKRAPLHAGKYAVYESAQVQCTSTVCPQLIMAPVKIGEFTVQTSAVVSPGPAKPGLRPAGYAASRAAVYNVRGELVDGAARTPRGIYIAKSEYGRVEIQNGLMR